MLYRTTLQEIETNTNPGVEYEIALFYKLLLSIRDEANQVMPSIKKRADSQKVLSIISYTREQILLNQLKINNLL